VTEHSALLVPVRTAEPLVRAIRERYDPSARAGVPAHVTLLTPFVDPAETGDGLLVELAEFFAACEPFTISFPRTARFPDTLYLAPDPAEPLRRLIEALIECYPGYPPYGGAFAEVVPHLTVAHGARAEVFDAIAAALRLGLPVLARIDEALLMAGPVTAGRASGPWREVARFPFYDSSSSSSARGTPTSG
jgi:2'-5' RNA ligase